MNKSLISDITLLQKVAPQMSGVFSIDDLSSLFREKNKATLFNKLKILSREGLLKRFKKEFYTTKDFSPEMLCARIDPTAYISMGSILAKNGLIGTSPLKVLSAVRVGRNRIYRSEDLEIRIYGITKLLYFGFNRKEGIAYADNEKAFLDLLYYRMRGAKYVFNELTDVDISQLNKKRINEYLTQYSNKKFVAFCKRVLNER